MTREFCNYPNHWYAKIEQTRDGRLIVKELFDHGDSIDFEVKATRKGSALGTVKIDGDLYDAKLDACKDSLTLYIYNYAGLTVGELYMPEVNYEEGGED